ncbi:MAG: RHS repeat-associated core domain-containing protein [Thermomonas sp.]
MYLATRCQARVASDVGERRAHQQRRDEKQFDFSGNSGILGEFMEVRIKHMTMTRLALVFIVGLCQPMAAFAQTTLSNWEKYLEPLQTSNQVTPYTFNSFGESTNLQDGSTSFSWTDIDIKGNNALPVRLQRRLTIEDKLHGGGDAAPTLAAFSTAEDAILLDVPYLKGTYSSNGWVVNGADQNARCNDGGKAPPAYSGGIFQPSDYWNGNWMHIPWVGDQEMLRSPASSIQKSGSAPLMTKDMWAFQCLNQTANGYPGEAFIAISPTGDKYYFDYVVSTGRGFRKRYSNYGAGIANLSGAVVYFFVTKIEDRFGNWVTYKYVGDKLDKIESSDGRYIWVTARVNGMISTVQSSIGTWHYNASNQTGSSQLVVTLPDTTTATYLGTGLLRTEPEDLPYVDYEPDCLPPQTPVGQYEFSVELPSGAMADYQFGFERHYISNVPKHCNAYLDNQGYSVQFLTIPNFHDSFTLMSKTVSGPGLPISQWTYSYPSNGVGDIGAFKDVCDNPPFPKSCPLTSTTIIDGPNGSYKSYLFGQMFRVNSGQLLKLEEGYTTGTAPNIIRNPLRTTENVYVSDAEAATAPFPAQVGSVSTSSADTVGSLLRPLKATSISQDGVTFSWQVPSTCNGNNTLCFDIRARAKTVVRSSTLGYSRTETTTYSDNVTKWVLGLVAQVKCVAPTTALPAGCGSSGTIMSETTYDSTYGLPLVSKAFGKVQQTLDYNFTAGTQDGTLKTIKDGRNNVTTLTNWYRGIPQTITYPATDDQLTPVTMTAIVSDAGWVTAVTDENGYSTGYGYDAMGRLASIVYPTGDSTVWNTTTITYVPVVGSEYGIPGGHWKRTESTGNGRKVTYYDGLWRPLVEEQYDNTNATTANNTRSLVVKRYDTSGRVAFQGYPLSTLTNYASTALKGTDTLYDALDRVTSVQQDSELGVLTTSTVYQTGFKVQVTNPRAVKTITAFMAFDQPTTNWPMDIDQADGKTEEADTDIGRDVFGKPLAITRHNPSASVTETRSYVYDTYQLLCKTIEPETGATFVDYDGASNILWSASGQTYTGPSCDRGSVAEADKAVRSYDARNRLKTLTFTDGRGNQSWTYTPDSLPATITVSNGFDDNLPVVNAYHYNKRRMLDGTGETVTEPNWYTWGIGYGWDANGHQSIQTYPEGDMPVDYAPNALGQPTQADSYATNVTYWPNGAIKRFVYGNGIVHEMTQNDRQLPETSKDSYNGTNTLYDSYVYDANANPLTILDGATGRGGRGERNMVYDALDRLTSTASPMFGNGATGTAQFTYDALDNLTKLVMPATATTAARTQYYCYDATSRRLASLRSATACGGSAQSTLTYDSHGNVETKVVSSTTLAYDFDLANRLKGITNNGVTVENYRYDGMGLRVLKNASAGNILSQYTRDGRLLQENNARTGVKYRYIYLGGSLVAVRESTISGGVVTVKYQHTDALGTPVAVTSSTRAVLERSEYEPFGQLLNRAQHDGPGFTGHVQDAMTGLTYMQQRYYDPMIGRFLSVDPVTATSVGGNFNRYWYANNNPYKFIDPDGRSSWGTTCTGSMLGCPTQTQGAPQNYTRSVGPIDCAGCATRDGGQQTRQSASSDNVTNKAISRLNPKVQGPATDFINQVEDEMGITLRVYQGFRTYAEQNKLYAKGRFGNPGPRVTNARGGESFHNFGLAIDLVKLNGDGSVSWDIDYKAISEIGKANGFEWGGNFQSIKDLDHFQMTFDLSLEQLRSGETP